MVVPHGTITMNSIGNSASIKGHGSAVLADPVNPGSVSHQLDHLDNVVEGIREELEMLDQKLGPVLCPEHPAGESSQSVDNVTCHVSDRVQSARSRLTCLRDRLTAIRGRVQL